MVFVPVIGSIAAGTPILAEENIDDYFPLSPDFVRGQKEVFMLNVHGDSMVNAGILDRDMVIVRKQDTAINGEIIAAMIEDEATVKRFFKTKSEIKLMPENDHMEPIVSKNVQVLGKVIGIIRKYF
jgi:repressor LexA